MHEVGPGEPYVSTSLRELGFAVERDNIIQIINLWRFFIKTEKVSNEFSGRPDRLKLRLSVAMNWNYAIENLDIAHMLMLQASLPPTAGLKSQQNLYLKFFTVLTFNV